MLKNLEQILCEFDIPVPRYTSFPAAPYWENLNSEVYKEHLIQSKGPYSVYVHIPFCHSMCLYCGCSVVLNRRFENEQRYVDSLCQEIQLVSTHLKNKPSLNQLHFGGGTPTKLTLELIHKIIKTLKEAFCFDPKAEIAIEIDPRTIVQDDGEKLKGLKNLGFNRVSFGVQDTNFNVQNAVKRRQSFEMSAFACDMAKDLEFSGINVDLIYGLPLQTPETFRKTIHDIIAMKPDRIAMFSYAKVPHLKPHQKAIKEQDLPSTKQKFLMYVEARQTLIEAGYESIGMDHFALKTDPLTQSYYEKTLDRNFQGYTVNQFENLLGFGSSAIGYVNGGYFQNTKDLKTYENLIVQERLPIIRGKVLTKNDQMHKWVIHTLMSRFSISKQHFNKKFGIFFDQVYQEANEQLKKLEEKGLVVITPLEIHATELGVLLIRIIASVFDPYFQSRQEQLFSRSV